MADEAADGDTAGDAPPGGHAGDGGATGPALHPPAAARVARDTLFAAGGEGATAEPGTPEAAVAAFRFDAAVARVFPDMLDRSIPGYASIVAQTGLFAARFARPHTRLYDLGCSLGASALSMRAALAARTGDSVPGGARDGAPDEDPGGARDEDPSGAPDEGAAARRRAIAASCTIHGIDNSAPMLARARDLVAEAERGTPADVVAPAVHLEEGDLADHPLRRCSVVAMNFTLQFVPPAERAALLGRIAASLVPGGVLILSEKLRFEDAAVDALNIEMYHAFKRANGYSALEVARKRAALEDVLVPDTLAEHRARLRAAGFARTSVWFQCFNFASLVAIR